ncbi:MAG: alpha/beta hydrolase [Myxococcaceae bacterium]
MSQQQETIVLIHGLWMTPLSWEKWVERYSSQGYRVITPGWPGLEGDVAEIRRNPERIAGLGIGEVVDHYERIIRELDRPPIIMGHSFGALMTQVLVDRGLGSAAVAISTAPVKGIIFLPFSTLKVSAPALLNPLNLHRAVPLTPEQFHYAFTNTLTEAESLKVYERYAVPGPDHLLFQAAFANIKPHAASTVNFENQDRAPLLFIAAEHDHIAPPAVVEATVRLYRRSKARTDYREFPGRSHYILGQDGWEEVADAALAWALANKRS